MVEVVVDVEVVVLIDYSPLTTQDITFTTFSTFPTFTTNLLHLKPLWINLKKD